VVTALPQSAGFDSVFFIKSEPRPGLTATGGAFCGALFALQREANTMQVTQGSDLGWLLVIVAVAAFLVGLCGERLRADPEKAARPTTPNGSKRRRKTPPKRGFDAT